MPFYSGAQFQRGHGLGSIFASIGRAVLPLVKSGAKAVGREVLKSGSRIASDVPGEPFSQPVSKRLK